MENLSNKYFTKTKKYAKLTLAAVVWGALVFVIFWPEPRTDTNTNNALFGAFIFSLLPCFIAVVYYILAIIARVMDSTYE